MEMIPPTTSATVHSKPYLVPINTDPSDNTNNTNNGQDDPYVSSDNPFSISLDHGTWQEFNISMESVYGIALVGPAVAPRKEFQRPFPANLPIIWAVFNQCYLMLLLNYVAQFTCIYYMSVFVLKAGGVPIMSFGDEDIDDDLASKTCIVDPFLRAVCVCLFLSAVLGEISETFMMLQWCYLTKTEKNHEAIQVSTTESGDVHLTSGFTLPHKMCQLMTVILPKFLIGITVMMYGSAFVVLSASNQDAFLNTMAAVFIVEIDELLHKAYVSAIVQKALADLPPIRIKLRPTVVAFDVTVSNLMLFLVVIVIGGWTSDRYCSERDIVLRSSNSSRQPPTSRL
jgi:hypothetical protein